jgi:hypothetical protein
MARLSKRIIVKERGLEGAEEAWMEHRIGVAWRFMLLPRDGWVKSRRKHLGGASAGPA